MEKEKISTLKKRLINILTVFIDFYWKDACGDCFVYFYYWGNNKLSNKFYDSKKINSTESTNLSRSFSHTDKYLSFKCLRQINVLTKNTVTMTYTLWWLSVDHLNINKLEYVSSYVLPYDRKSFFIYQFMPGQQIWLPLNHHLCFPANIF